MTQLDHAIADWRASLGDAVVSAEAAVRARYERATTGARRRVPAVLQPKRAADVAALVAIAAKHRIALYPVSTGNNWGYGSACPAVDGCVPVDLGALKRIIDFDRDSGLVTLEPGVTQGELREFLDRERLSFLVPVTGAGPNCSLIGNALERGYGITPFTDHFAAVMSLEAVLADGSIFRSAHSALGGQSVDRAFKWGFGPYLDGLFAQSGFGIVTQMTIALARRPERVESFFFSLNDDRSLEQAVNTIRELLSSLGGVLGSINLMNRRRVLAMTTLYPSALATDRGTLPPDVLERLARPNRVGAWTGVGAMYGPSALVREAKRIVRRALKPFTQRLLFFTPESAGRVARLARLLPSRLSHHGKAADALAESLQLMAGAPSDVALTVAYWKKSAGAPIGIALDPQRDECGLIWYPPLVPMKPERARTYVNLVHEVCLRFGIEPLITLTSLSDRCFDSSVPILFDLNDERAVENANACYRALFEAGRREGFLPYRLGADSMRWACDEPGAFWDTVRAIKGALDPDNIMSPGRYSPLY